LIRRNKNKTLQGEKKTERKKSFFEALDIPSLIPTQIFNIFGRGKRQKIAIRKRKTRNLYMFKKSVGSYSISYSADTFFTFFITRSLYLDPVFLKHGSGFNTSEIHNTVKSASCAEIFREQIVSS
jgi:hypothetical protein